MLLWARKTKCIKCKILFKNRDLVCDVCDAKNDQSPSVLWDGWITIIIIIILVTKCVDNSCKCAPHLVIWHRGQNYMLTMSVCLFRCFCKSIETSWPKWWHKHIEHLVCFLLKYCKMTVTDGTQTQEWMETFVLRPNEMLHLFCTRQYKHKSDGRLLFFLYGNKVPIECQDACNAPNPHFLS